MDHGSIIAALDEESVKVLGKVQAGPVVRSVEIISEALPRKARIPLGFLALSSKVVGTNEVVVPPDVVAPPR
jgi:hypothetical protein